MGASNKPGYAISIYGTVDPSAGAGVQAPIGCLYQRVAGTYSSGRAGTLWLKTGSADTAWTQVQVVVVDTTQEFSYVVTGAEGNPFSVALPTAAPSGAYNVHIQQANVDGSPNAFKQWRNVYDINSNIACRIECNAPPEAGDVLMITIKFPT